MLYQVFLFYVLCRGRFLYLYISDETRSIAMSAATAARCLSAPQRKDPDTFTQINPWRKWRQKDSNMALPLP